MLSAKNQRARAVASARCVHRKNGVVVVAFVALANEQAWEVLADVLAVGRVDRLLDLLARDALHRGGNLRG